MEGFLNGLSCLNRQLLGFILLCVIYEVLPSSFSGHYCPNLSLLFPAVSPLLRLPFPLPGSLIPKFLNLETPSQILAVFNADCCVPSLFIHCDVTTAPITSTNEEKT